MAVLAILLLATYADALTLDGQCEFQFFAKSTLHDFEGKGTCQPFFLNSERMASGEELIKAPSIVVLVNGMDTDNSARDKKMYAMFENQRFPEIKGLFSDLKAETILQQLKDEGDTAGHLDFNLQIRTISKPVAATARDLLITPEQISFRMEFPLSLADFQLDPPSVLGMIRVDDQVRVEVMVVLNRH
jgi:hypothetical protein